MIRYYLIGNALTSDPDDQFAKVMPNIVYDLTDTVREILRRNSTLTEADVLATLTVFFELICYELSRGNAFNLPILSIYPAISGVFKSPAATFNSAEHLKRVVVNATGRLAKSLVESQTEKVFKPMATPALLLFTDRVSGETNGRLTSGGIGRIVGEFLQMNLANILEGIFFIDSEGVETKVAVIDTNENKKLIFSIPNLPAGTYSLEVRRGYGTTVVAIRIGKLDRTLTVV